MMMTLDITWRDVFIDDILALIPPGCGFSIQDSFVYPTKFDLQEKFLLTHRGVEIGLLEFYKAKARFIAHNDPDKECSIEAEFNDPKCTPDVFALFIAKAIDRKRVIDNKEKG